jgi:hypothetical protein
MSGLKMPFSAGLPETGCGAGSTFTYTAPIREALPQLLRELDVKTLLDAPCGDMNWMARTDLSGIDYIGCDYDEEHIRSANMRESQPYSFRPRSKSILQMDICREKLPQADMILCRDFLQHLPNAKVFDVLDKLALSGIRWLLLTSHVNAENEDIDSMGMFRPINLTNYPFVLPDPVTSIPDGEGRILGLWDNEA